MLALGFLSLILAMRIYFYEFDYLCLYGSDLASMSFVYYVGDLKEMVPGQILSAH